MHKPQRCAATRRALGTGSYALQMATRRPTNNDIEIDVDGVSISTTNNSERGIRALHAGGTFTDSGNITIDVDGTAAKNTISTSGGTAEGVLGSHAGASGVDIDVTGVGISTAGSSSAGVYGAHTGTGDIDIEGTTTGRTISGYHGTTGPVTVSVRTRWCLGGIRTWAALQEKWGRPAVGRFRRAAPRGGGREKIRRAAAVQSLFP